ncbi:hypothetical protein Bbelb_415990 [Branchiostoma belcheri]|nr:hypothetical protein Bbelb_415990 [Branchiostoma belcheri]
MPETPILSHGQLPPISSLLQEVQFQAKPLESRPTGATMNLPQSPLPAQPVLLGCLGPTIVRFERDDNMVLAQGEDLLDQLVCEASGIPTPTITIIPPSGLNKTVESGVFVEDGNITLRNVTAADAGLYVCIASNPVGSTFAIFSTEVVKPVTSVIFTLPVFVGSDRQSMMGVLMFLLVILKVLGAAETCSCTSSPYCRCVGQGLTSIPPDLPTSIIGLNLGQNLITTLSQSDFSEIAALSPDMFTGLGNLERLELESNKITDIQAKTFSSTPNLITCSQPDNLSGQNLIRIDAEDLMTDCQKPNITRFERIGNYLLIQGETLRLVCEASGIPTTGITVRLPSGLEFNATVESGGRVTVWENGTIIVTDVTAADSGRYVCIATNSAGSTLAYFSADVVYFETSPTFSLPILILYLIGAVAGTLVIVAIVLTIWCKCCRKDRSVGPNAGAPSMISMGRRRGARVAWDHPLGM